MGTVVVGVDGSETSLNALRWAVDEAEVRDDDLKVVYVFDHRPGWSPSLHYVDSSTPEQMDKIRNTSERETTEARERAKAFLDSKLREFRDRDVAMTPLVVEDRQPAGVLIEQSENADMLVVGSRGRGGFAGLVLGSVSQQCVQHARSPVVVIPAPA